jgi:DNA mismatch repair protein MLH3
VSLLSVVSRHHQYRSHNALTFHHGKAIERQLPAAPHHAIYGQHGTRVTVRNLFGNLPVRVKQRSKVVEQKAENGRLWDHVKANVTGLLLNRLSTISLRARDADNRVVFAFNTSDARPSRLTSMLNILTQANYISVQQWSSWVPASACTSSLSIKGAISLEPIPTRNVQFISLGARPLSADSTYNEIYDEVNRLFSLSSFGSVEDDSELDPKADKSFGTTSKSNIQTKARKGVDRCPMFHLHISFREGSASKFSEDRVVDNETSIESIMGVLCAMITQWLSVHHFRPVRLRQKQKDPGTSFVSRVRSSGDERTAVLPRCLSQNSTSSSPSNQTKSTAARAIFRTAKWPRMEPTNRLQNCAFANWSRVKSGKAEFFDEQSAPKRLASSRAAADPLTSHTGGDVDLHSKCVTSTRLSTQTLAQGALSISAPKEDGLGDDTLLWIDPVTKQTHVLNARTGCMIPLARPRPASDPSATPLEKPLVYSTTSFRAAPMASTGSKTTWLDGILKNWDNPVFKSSEQCIEQVFPKEPDPNNVLHPSAQHRCLHVGADTSLDMLPVMTSRLSKDSLEGAEVVAQVDKKFILIKTLSLVGAGTPEDAQQTLLVLVDQHAADERIRVETLFRQLCMPMTSNCSSYQSKLGYSAQVASTVLEKPIKFTISQHEQLHFTTHAERFAFWGILFDVETTNIPESLGASRETQDLLSVIALPPSISERCIMNTELLISLLRSTVWRYASNSNLPSHPSMTRDTKPPDWVGRLATCPEGLVDMINSRACRSAIMFNDELDLHQCRKLIRNLAGCVFPFMCAHGRPTLVPLVEIGKAGHRNLPAELDSHAKTGNFLRDWKEWNH